MGVVSMSKAKGKSGTGRGTGKKGWNRWQAKSNKVKSAKPYVSKGKQRADEGASEPKVKTKTLNVNSLVFPNDADGDALRSLYKEGLDFKKQHSVEFFVAAKDKDTADRLANVLKNEGYNCFLEEDDETGEWSCCCSKKMLLDYQTIVNVQNELDRISKPLGGFSDGWGVFVD
jgi:regulator of RNase E activity RraB